MIKKERKKEKVGEGVKRGQERRQMIVKEETKGKGRCKQSRGHLREIGDGLRKHKRKFEQRGRKMRGDKGG